MTRRLFVFSLNNTSDISNSWSVNASCVKDLRQFIIFFWSTKQNGARSLIGISETYVCDSAILIGERDSREKRKIRGEITGLAGSNACTSCRCRNGMARCFRCRDECQPCSWTRERDLDGRNASAPCTVLGACLSLLTHLRRCLFLVSGGFRHPGTCRGC